MALTAEESAPDWPGPGIDMSNVDPLTGQVFRAFSRVMRLHRQVALKSMSERGVRHSDAFCLRLLAKHEGMNQRELAGMLHLSPPHVTKILQSLERHGLVVRRVDEADQRRTLVFITPEGRAEELRCRASMDLYFNQTIGGLREEDRRELVRLFNLIADRIEASIQSGEWTER